METFKTRENGEVNNHMIDNGGNHFIVTVQEDGRKVYQCVNPLKDEYEGVKVGDTYPNKKDRIPSPEITGYVELKVVEQPRGSGHMITVPV